MKNHINLTLPAAPASRASVKMLGGHYLKLKGSEIYANQLFVGLDVTVDNIVALFDVVSNDAVPRTPSALEVSIAQTRVLIERVTSGAPTESEWKPGEAIIKGDIRVQHEVRYEAIQPHITQADWPPMLTPALWKPLPAEGEIPAWAQPSGAHDAYAAGDKVTHAGATWESLVAANTWEPSAATPTLWKQL